MSNTFNLSDFFNNGGTIHFIADEKALKNRLSSSSISVSAILHKFIFYDKNGDVLLNIYDKTFILDDKTISLEKSFTKLLAYKNKYISNFPNHRFPDIIFCKKQKGHYLKLQNLNSFIIIDPNFLQSSGVGEFTMGHELGHHYIEEEKIQFSGAKNYWLYISYLYSILCMFSIIDIYYTEDLKMKFLSMFAMGAILLFNLYFSFTWRSRSKNYQKELFCDDFSFWINDNKVLMYGFGQYPFISGWKHPTDAFRIHRNKNISSFKDIKPVFKINSFYNFIILELPMKRKHQKEV